MSENGSDGLRQLPAVNEILALPEIASLSAARGRESVRDWARAAVDDLRRRLRVELADILGTPLLGGTQTT